MKFDVSAFAIALLSGVMMAFQGTINSALGRHSGLWETSFFVHIIGAAILLAGLFIKVGFRNIENALKAPWYLFLGGPLGVLIIYGVAYSIPKIGAAPTTTWIIIGQVLSACMIDHFGLFGLKTVDFGIIRIAGIALLAIGGWLILKK